MQIINQAPTSKYGIGDTLYCFNIGMQNPLVTKIVVLGVVKNDDGLYYSADKSMWIKEEYLYPSRKDSYKAIISQAQNEMESPEAIN